MISKNTFFIPHFFCLIIFYLNFVFLSNLNSQQCNWQFLGVGEMDQVTPGLSYEIGFDIDKSDMPYLLFRDSKNNYKATVKKLINNTWTILGSPGFSTTSIGSFSMQIDSNNIPYVAFIEYLNGLKTTVMKFDGTNWIIVGSSAFSAGGADYLALKFDKTNVLHLAYADATNGNKITLKKWVNNTWTNVGNSGFSFAAANDISLEFDTANKPHVSYYYVLNNLHYVRIEKFDGTNWVGIGTSTSAICGSSSGNSYKLNHVDLKINNNNEVYVAHRNWSLALPKACVRKLVGNNLVLIGGNGISDYGIEGIKLELDSLGNPMVLYADVLGFNNVKYIFKKFNGLTWQSVGTEIIYEPSIGLNLKLKRSSKTGKVFYANSDNFYDNPKRFTSIKKLVNNEWTDITSKGLRDDWLSYPKFHHYKLDRNETPHKVILDNIGIRRQLSIYKYINGNWSRIGSKLDTLGYSENYAINFDDSNHLYVALTDYYSGSLVIKKFNGSNWQTLGTIAASNNFYFLNLVIDHAGICYVYSVSSTTQEVHRFDGISWQLLPSPGLKNFYTLKQPIAVDNTNTLFIVSPDALGKPYLKKYNGTTWTNELLPTTLQQNSFGEFYLLNDINGNLALGITRSTVQIVATVLSYLRKIGNSWQVVTSSLVPITYAQNSFLDFKINRYTGTPYLSDFNSPNKPNIVVFNGSSWVKACPKDSFIDTPMYWQFEVTSNDELITSYSLEGSGIYSKKFTSGFSLNSPSALCAGTSLNMTASNGHLYQWSGPNNFSSTNSSVVINNINTNQGGIYQVAITDSICGTAVKQVNVTVNPTYAVSVNASICNGDSLLFNGAYYKSAITTLANLISSKGCDSIVTLNLTIKQPSTSADTKQACNKFTWLNGVTYTTSNTTAQFTLQNAGGCDSTITLNLTLDTVNTLVSTNDTVLVANVSGVKYQWINCANGKTIIVGDTNQSFTATSNGSYAVIVNKNGCIDTSACVTINSIGLSKINLNKQLRIHPNPSNGRFNVDTEYAGLLIISDAIGRELMKVNVVSGSNQIDLSQCTDGIYVAKFNSKVHQSINRLIISK
jgi:Secretion system C-terminal sorting domain